MLVVDGCHATKAVLCLGAWLAKPPLGVAFGLMKQRGELLSMPYAEQAMATLHSSVILRATDEASREGMMEMVGADLVKAAGLVMD